MTLPHKTWQETSTRRGRADSHETHIGTISYNNLMSLSSSSGRVSYAPSNSAVVDPGTTGTFISKINAVNLGMMGLVGGLSPGFTVGDLKSLERFAIKAGVYEALKKQLAASIDALASRQIIPKLDFEDGNSNPITQSEWRQPWSGATPTPRLVAHISSIRPTRPLIMIRRCMYYTGCAPIHRSCKNLWLF